MKNRTGALERTKNFILSSNGIVWIILALLFIVSAISNPIFLKGRNLRNVFLIQSIGLGLASLAQVFIVLSGGIDLSIGAVISLLTSLAAGIYKQHPELSPIVMVLLLIGAGAAAGGINGFIVVKLRVTPFMATIATMSIFQGAALFYAKKTMGGIPRSFRWIADGSLGPIPVAFLFFVLIIGLCYYLLRKNKLGKYIYAVGADPYVSGLSGIRVERIRFYSYLIGGILVGCASVFLAARMGGGGPKVGVGYELDSITAVVIGGVSLAGGMGNIISAFGGVLIIGVFSNLMNILKINPFIQIVLKGLVLIIAVSFYSKKKVG